MRTFLIGSLVAVLLTGGAAYLFTLMEVTMAERSSPARSVRIEDDASKSAEGAGYGSPQEHSGISDDKQETARR